jgi:hypothetical protein
MIHESDQQLAKWIKTIVDGATVSFDPPGNTQTKTVGVYLMDLAQTAPDRGSRRPPFLMTLRYLVTTHAPKTEDAHQMLGALVVAALENSEFEVEQDPLPVSLWSALGIPPRPAFVIRVPFRHERPQKLAPPVKHPLIVKRLPLRSFIGRVVGPDNIPIMNAQVELPSLDLTTNTDSKGKFSFSSIPDEPGVKVLRIRAKGQEFSINAKQAESETEPLVIQLQLEG